MPDSKRPVEPGSLPSPPEPLRELEMKLLELEPSLAGALELERRELYRGFSVCSDFP